MGNRRDHSRRGITLAVALAVMAAGLVLATPSTPAGAVTLVAQGSVQQVFVTGATPGATVELLDASNAVVASGPADDGGAFIFGNDPREETPIPPGAGYRVRQGGDVSASVTVLDPGDHPDQSFYDAQDLAIAPAGLWQDPEIGYQYLETRDGTTLSVNVLPPLDPAISPPYPVVVDYSGYDPSDPDIFSSDPDHRPMFVARAAGYAVVGVNLRGTTCSGGAYSYWETLQGLDGYDVIETVAAQPWASRVGMIGLSFPGISQLFVAATQPPHLAAITPQSVIGDTYRSTLYPGGILNGGFAVDWAAERDGDARPAAHGWVRDRIAAGDTECAANQVLHTQAVPILPQLDPEAYYEAAGDSLAPRTFVDRIEVPTYLGVAWQDEQTGGEAANLLDDFTSLGGPGEPPLRAQLMNGAHAEQYTPESYLRILEFLDFYVGRRVPGLEGPLRQYANFGFAELIGAPGVDLPPDRVWPDDFEDALAQYEAEPPIRVSFEQGAAGTGGRACPDGDRSPAPCPSGYPYSAFSQTFESWPPPATSPWRLFLQPDGGLGEAPPTVPDPSPRGADTYRYDGTSGSTGIDAARNLMSPNPGFSWAANPEGTSLSFLTPPLDEDKVMVGTASVDLWLRSTAPDVDLEVDLTEVRPDGKETYIQSGWLRASHRALGVSSTELLPFHTHLAADAADLPPGEFVPARVAIFPFGHIAHEGSQLRLTIKSPGGNRVRWRFTNLQYPTDQFVDVAHSVGRPSSVVLPVLSGIEVPSGRPACEALRSQPCRAFVASRAPTGVTATVSVADRAIDVSWTAPASPDAVTGYEVSVAPTGETFPVGAGSTSFTYPSPDPGLRYSFSVRATFAGGPGPASTSSLESPGPAGFSDVPATAWYAPGVDWTTAYGALSGSAGGLFKPAKAATRAQAALALWTVAGRPAASGDGAVDTDVPETARYAPAVDWLDDAGIDPGFADGTFRPRDPINRARLAVWFHRASGLVAGSPASTYPDVPDAAWYSGAADWWQAQGLGAPVSGSSFKPKATVKRNQLAGWLWNLARTPAAWGAGYPY
ncbi:MAG: CocE/NonD family hydrolase [Acidimicrobiales bacterium]|nr:CocE/NonD family hydrolase [Acidimicrobiales bacterium]